MSIIVNAGLKTVMFVIKAKNVPVTIVTFYAVEHLFYTETVP
jgi:hypothetical protein